MWLYHGTYDMYYSDIKKSGVITPSKHPDTMTLNLDNLINARASRRLRGGCVYLSDDIEVMWGFDNYFRISSTKLDTGKLFVADNSQLDMILASKNYERAVVYADNYIKSYIKFDDFLHIKDSYRKQYSPEFLYFGHIQLRMNK